MRIRKSGLEDQEAAAEDVRQAAAAHRKDDPVLAAVRAVARSEIEAIEDRDGLEAHLCSRSEWIDLGELSILGSRTLEAVAVGIDIWIIAVTRGGRRTERTHPALVDLQRRGVAPN